MSIIKTNSTFTPTGLSAATFRSIARGYRDSQSALTSVEVPPWGTYVVHQRGGVGARTISMTVQCESLATYTVLRGYLGKLGVLVWPRGAVAGENAVLESCDQDDTLILGGAIAATCTFTVGTT